jgi:predicted PurR-regulated permease PerM
MGIPELVVVLAIALMALVVVWPAAQICRRLGFPRWLGLLVIVPVANVLLLWFVATAQWPRVDTARRSI